MGRPHSAVVLRQGHHHFAVMEAQRGRPESAVVLQGEGDSITVLWLSLRGGSLTQLWSCQEGELLPSQLWNVSDHRSINIC